MSSRIMLESFYSTVLLPENSDELWREQLWPECFDLGNISQKPQHVAVKLLLIRKLLE